MINRQRIFAQLLGKSRMPARTFSSLAKVDGSQAASAGQYKTLWDISENAIAEREQKAASEADYLASLRQINNQRGVFQPFAASKSDIPAIKKIKNKINSIVEKELVLQDFKDKLDQEALTTAAYNEVITRKNFYFQVDETKKAKNIAVHNIKAPGNKYRKPSYIIPHEHVTVEHAMDTTGLEGDKLWELYGYYAYLVDLHIAQVRPESLDEKSYIPKRFNQVEHTKKYDSHLNNRFFEYYHRWREPTRTWFSQTQEINFQEQLKNRPTTTHYDHDKGTKYEIEWRDDQKFPHVADRLGYPILREEPIERILGIERAPAHPGYQFQPFVQTPSMEPDATLSFKQGEVIYENRGVVEWTRFWKTVTGITFGITPGFYVFEMYAADGAPSLSWMADNWNWWQIPKQFQDGGGQGMETLRYCDDHEYMNFHYSAKRGVVRPSHTMYMCQVLVLLQYMNMDYVSKMVYNKDKDLVFVYKPTGLWNEQEYVYEMHHLEQMVPFAVTAIKNMSMQRDDGIITVYDMNTRDNLKFYAEDKYWNLDVKDEFMANTRTLWKGNFDDKYQGSIFSVTSRASEEEALTMMKVDRELEAAIAKHGETVIPSQYETEWEARVAQERQKIAARHA